MVEIANKIFALVAIVGQIALAAIFVLWIFSKRVSLAMLGKYAMAGAFIVYIGAMGASLFYSDVIGFSPCTLCWWQRIFLYPQVILLGLALMKKDDTIIDYSIALAIPGAFLALYHTYIIYGGAPLIPCSAQVVSCAKRYVFEFGYVTIPLMSLTAFLLGITCLLIYKEIDRV